MGQAEGGTSLPKPMLRHGGFARRKPAGGEEVDAHGVGAGEAVESGPVGVSNWLGDVGKEISFTVGRAFPGTPSCI